VSVDIVRYKTAELIETLFGLRTPEGPWNHVLGGARIPPWDFVASYLRVTTLGHSQYSQLYSPGGSSDAALDYQSTVTCY